MRVSQELNELISIKLGALAVIHVFIIFVRTHGAQNTIIVELLLVNVVHMNTLFL